MISHELGLAFNSPTVNLWINDEDYLKFLTNPEHYLETSFSEVQSDRPYPVGVLDDITIYFQHYQSFEEGVSKWKQRCERIRWDNIYVLFVYLTDHIDAAIKRFLSFDYKNKAVLSFIPLSQSKEIHFMKNASGMSMDKISGLCAYQGKFTGERYFDDFDYVTWFNEA